jgi:hypothetical protein
MLPEGPRKPLKASFSGTPDRRRNRLKLPPCPDCGSEDVRVNLRVDYALYLMCNRCIRIYSVPKPGYERFGT